MSRNRPDSPPEDFGADYSVSRETIDRLQVYVDLLRRWNRRINLIAPGTLPEVWSRHIADSIQLLDLAPPTARCWLDLGTGAGLPGLAVAIVAAERRPHLSMTLVDSDRRKAAFLMTATRVLDLPVRIVVGRAETLPAQPYDVISARALAPLTRLLDLAHRLRGPDTVCLFPKGRGVDSELTAASARWHIRCQRVPSRTEAGASVLRIVELEPRQ